MKKKNIFPREGEKNAMQCNQQKEAQATRKDEF